MSVNPNNAGLLGDAPLLAAQYHVQELLGEGGMGRVYLAEHRLTGQRVAIKALRTELSSDEVFRSRFLHEARVLSRLDHPSITHLFNFIEEADGRLFLVMQYVAGRTLEQLLQEVGPLPPAVAMTIMHHVLEACDYAHQQRVIHRDIKPANIVLPPGGGVKVMDFGIARMDSGIKLTSTGASLGSPAYMAPEQVTGKPLDSRCDIYSLGVMLFEMMTGDIPFPGDNGYTVMKMHVEQPAPDPRDIVAMPDRVAEAILWAMKKDPADRPATAAILSGTLPTAEELGGSEDASWAYILDDRRSAVEVTMGAGQASKPSRLARSPRILRPLPPPAALPAEATPHGTMSRSIPDPPRGSPVFAILAMLVVIGLAVMAFSRWMHWVGPPVQSPRASMAGLSTDVLIVRGAEMVHVPAGGGLAGFYMDRTEVTYRQFRSFLETCAVGSACGPRDSIPALQLANSALFQVIDHPVSQVTFNDADAFCKWAGKRLPTSDEWARAASGDDHRIYPWGQSPTEGHAWVSVPVASVKERPGQLGTLSVNDLQYYQDDSPFHVMGLGGDVSEWLADADASDRNLRQVAGASWSSYDIANDARVVERLSKAPGSASSSIGFRCAMDEAGARQIGAPSRLSVIHRDNVVRVGAEQESPPMLFTNDKKQQEGFEHELMTELASALKVRMQFSPAMYPDLPSKLRGDRIDLIVSAYTPDESIRGVEWSAPYLEYGLCLVVRKESPLKTLQDLTGKVVGHYNDPATARTVARLVPGARKLVSYENRYMEDLRDGQIDAFIYDFPFVQAEIVPFIDLLRVSEYGLTEATYNVGVPEGEWSLLREVNLAIHAWRDSEAYAELIKRYLGGAPAVNDIPPGARTTLVARGDTLRTVARRELGREDRWTDIWQLNRNRLGNQNLLYAGTPLVLPDR